MPTPKVILHSSISLDGSLLGFAVDMQAHYHIVGSYHADVHLVGSNTAKEGLKMFCPRIPEEKSGDFIRPKRDKSLPLWVIPDTKGQLKGVLHVLRGFDLCRDILIVVSGQTPKAYIEYLKKRDYAFHAVAKKHVDYADLFKFLVKEHEAKIILTDTGKILNCLLLNKGLIDEISLLVHPVMVGKKRYPLLGDATENIRLRLIKNKVAGKDKVWLVYKCLRPNR